MGESMICPCLWVKILPCFINKLSRDREWNSKLRQAPFSHAPAQDIRKNTEQGLGPDGPVMITDFSSFSWKFVASKKVSLLVFLGINLGARGLP